MKEQNFIQTLQGIRKNLKRQSIMLGLTDNPKLLAYIPEARARYRKVLMRIIMEGTVEEMAQAAELLLQMPFEAPSQPC